MHHLKLNAAHHYHALAPYLQAFLFLVVNCTTKVSSAQDFLSIMNHCGVWIGGESLTLPNAFYQSTPLQVHTVVKENATKKSLQARTPCSCSNTQSHAQDV